MPRKGLEAAVKCEATAAAAPVLRAPDSHTSCGLVVWCGGGDGVTLQQVPWPMHLVLVAQGAGRGLWYHCICRGGLLAAPGCVMVSCVAAVM